MGHITLLALGKVRMKVLEYLNKRNDLLVIKLETRYMKNKRKGMGLKIQVIKKIQKQMNKHLNATFLVFLQLFTPAMFLSVSCGKGLN